MTSAGPTTALSERCSATIASRATSIFSVPKVTSSKDKHADADRVIGAVYRKDRSEVLSLLRAGIDINATDRDGRTPLMHAVLALDADVGFVAFLLDHGADLTWQDKQQRWSALHFAARDGRPEIVALLLQRGATVDATDVYGNTPLWRATFQAHRDPKSLDVIGLLLKAHADPKLENKSGISPLTLASDPGREKALALLQSATSR